MSTLLCGGVAVQDGTTSLYDACSRGDTPIVKQLLATSGVDTSRSRYVCGLLCLGSMYACSQCVCAGLSLCCGGYMCAPYDRMEAPRCGSPCLISTPQW
jgi:hypothetical protein